MSETPEIDPNTKEETAELPNENADSNTEEAPKAETKSDLNDIELTCRDCNNTFAFTGPEQEFYNEKGFTNQPGRCPDCRLAKKRARRGRGRGRGRGGRGRGRGSFGGPRGGNACFTCGEEGHFAYECPQRDENDKGGARRGRGRGGRSPGGPPGVCFEWSESQSCKYGDTCRFAHN